MGAMLRKPHTRPLARGEWHLWADTTGQIRTEASNKLLSGVGAGSPPSWQRWAWDAPLPCHSRGRRENNAVCGPHCRGNALTPGPVPAPTQVSLADLHGDFGLSGRRRRRRERVALASRDPRAPWPRRLLLLFFSPPRPQASWVRAGGAPSSPFCPATVVVPGGDGGVAPSGPRGRCHDDRHGGDSGRHTHARARYSSANNGFQPSRPQPEVIPPRRQGDTGWAWRGGGRRASVTSPAPRGHMTGRRASASWRARAGC